MAVGPGPQEARAALSRGNGRRPAPLPLPPRTTKMKLGPPEMGPLAQPLAQPIGPTLFSVIFLGPLAVNILYGVFCFILFFRPGLTS